MSRGSTRHQGMKKPRTSIQDRLSEARGWGGALRRARAAATTLRVSVLSERERPTPLLAS
jgi:hypothetical protein